MVTSSTETTGHPGTSPLQPPGQKTILQESRRFNRSVLFSFVRYAVMIATGFGFSMVYAHMLGAEIVGLVALMTSILGLLRPVSSMGEQFALVPALNRYPPGHGQAIALFWSTVTLSAAITLALSLPFALITNALLVHVYHRPDLQGLLLFYLVGFYSIYNLVLMLGAPYYAYQEMKAFAWIELLTGIARIVLLVGLILILGPSPLAAVAALVGGNAVNMLILLVMIPKPLRYFANRLSMPRLTNDLREVYRFSIKSMPGHASISIHQHADRLILGLFTSPAMLGVYTLAYSLFERVLMMGTNYENMVFSSSARLAANSNFTTISSIYRSALKTSFFLITPGVILLAGFSDLALSVFGPDFVQGHHALTWLLVGIMFDNFGRITLGLMGGLNRPGLKATVMALGAIINLGFGLLLIPFHGIEGAAVANTIGYVVMAGLCLGWVLRQRRVTLMHKGFFLKMGVLLIVNALILAALMAYRHFFDVNLLGSFLFALIFLPPYYLLGRRWATRPEPAV